VRARRDAVEARLQEMREGVHVQRLQDLAFDEFAYGDAMSRDFFEDMRRDRVDSTLRRVRTVSSGTRATFCTQRAMEKEARRFFGGDGVFQPWAPAY